MAVRRETQKRQWEKGFKKTFVGIKVFGSFLASKVTQKIVFCHTFLWFQVNNFASAPPPQFHAKCGIWQILSWIRSLALSKRTKSGVPFRANSQNHSALLHVHLSTTRQGMSRPQKLSQGVSPLVSWRGRNWRDPGASMSPHTPGRISVKVLLFREN